MLFTSAIFAVFASIMFISNIVAAMPMPVPMRRMVLQQRQPELLEIIQTYKRNVAVQSAAMSLDGTVVQYVNNGKRDVAVQSAAMSLDGTVVPYTNNGH